jgi:alpha-tubulin suppressor-like RCC1 family protein
MIINSKKIYPIAEQTGLSFSLEITPQDYSKNIISFKEFNNLNFILESGKFSDANNRSTYFYNTGQPFVLSGNINNTNYDYHINNNLISLSGQKQNFVISGISFSGTNLDLGSFKVLGETPDHEVKIDDSFIFGQALNGWIKNYNTNSLNFRVLSGSITTPTGFSFGSIPNTIITSGYIGIDTNFNNEASSIPLDYVINFNLLTDFGLINKSFNVTGIPGSFLEFFISITPEFFNLDTLNSGLVYTLNSFFKSGNIERDKVIDLSFTYEGGTTGLVLQQAQFFGSGYNDVNLNRLITGSGLFAVTGNSLLSGYYNGNLITGLGIGTGYIQTGITGGNFKQNILITGTGIYNTQVFNLNTFVISGYEENILGSGFVTYSGNLTGYISPFSGSGTYNFYSGFSSILDSQASRGILRKNEFFTGILNYQLSRTGLVKLTGFNTTYLDYTGYSDGITLTGLLEGSGYIYSAPTNFDITGILRSEAANQRVEEIKNIQVVDFVLNTGINLAKIVAIVSGEATGNYLNNPDIFGISILGTGSNVLTGLNLIYGSGFITGFNTGYIIKDSFITTGNISGVIFYLATGDSNNPSNPSNYVQALYNTLTSGNRLYSGFSLNENLTFTGELTSPIRFTGNINQFGRLYSNPVSLTGVNTVNYISYSGIQKTGIFTKISNNIILERNDYFTGISNYNTLLPATGISSGANDTLYYWEQTVAATNKTFTGIITIGSGNLITSPVSFGSPVTTSGILSGQVGTGINYITISQTVLNPHITQINNIFFTGEKREIRDIIVSGLATGQKYNFVGLNVSGSGYILSYGSGYLTGSGFINVTGYGELTGTDGSTINTSITGSTFVSLSGNSNNINDPINVIYRDQFIISTGTGFFNIFNKNITGLTSTQITLSGIYNLTGSGTFALNNSDNVFGTGRNLTEINKYQIFSGLIDKPSIVQNLFFTGISNQFINPSPWYAVATGSNNTQVNNIIFVLESPITLSGYITGTGLISASILTGFSGTLPDSIYPSIYQSFTGQNFAVTQNQSATGLFISTGLFSNFSGIYTGLFYQIPAFIPYFDEILNLNNSRNLVQINPDYFINYNLSSYNSITGIDILNISGKENLFILGNFTGLNIGASTGEIITNSKYYILPYNAGGSGNLTGLYETLTGIIQFPNDTSSINKIIYNNNYIIFGGNFRDYIDVKNSFSQVGSKGGIAVNLTGGFISNWYIDPTNVDDDSTIKNIVFINKDKVLLGGNFTSILTEERKGFAMVDFRGDGAFPDDDTNLSGVNLYLEGKQSPSWPYPFLDPQVNSIIYNTGEQDKYYVLGDFINALNTGERLKTKTISANNNFYARPKTSKRINALLLKADMTGLADQEDTYYRDYIGVSDYGYKVIDFESPASENGPRNISIYDYKEISGNYYLYGQFNNVGSRFRKGFGAFNETSGFIKNANVNLEGNTTAIESSGDYIFVGGSIKSYGGIPYGFGGDDIDHQLAGYGIKNQLTIDRTFVPIHPYGGGYAIYDIKQYNNKVYVVGNFDFIRMPTGNETDTASMNIRSSFAVFDLSGNLLPETLHFTQYDGDYETYGGYDVRSLFISGNTGYFGGNFECVVGNGLESNLPIGTSIRYSGYRTAAFNLNTLHPITGYTGHFDGTVYQIDHFTGGYIIAVGSFDTYYRPYNQFSKSIRGACVLNALNGTGIFQSGACPTISGNYFPETNDFRSQYNDLRGYYRRADGHYYLYGRLIRAGSFDNLGLMLFNGTGGNTSVNQFGAAIRPNDAITGFRFLLRDNGDYGSDIYVNSVLENGNDLLVGGYFDAVSGRNSEYIRATGLIVINENSGMLVNTGINIGLLRGGLDGNWDQVFDIKNYSNKIYVGGAFRHFKFDGEYDPSGIGAGKFAVFDTGYNIERSLGCYTYDGSSYIYKIYSGANRAYLVGRHFGNGDNNYYTANYSISVQSPKYWDYVNDNNGDVGRIGLVQLNRSGYELPLTPINLSGIYLNNENEAVNVIRKHESGLFLGGNFTSINGIPRTGLAWISYNCDIKDWNPQIDANFGIPVQIKDMIISGDSLIFVGNFAQINGLNRAGAAQVKITGLGTSIGEVTDLNLNSNYGFSDNFVNVIYNDPDTTGYYVGGNFSDGLIKINKNTLNISPLDFKISTIYKSGVMSFNKINDNYLVGGNFVGFSGNSQLKDFAVFKLSGERVSGLLSTPSLSISGVSDIQIKDNNIYIANNNSSRSYKFNINEAKRSLELNDSWTPYFSKYSSNNTDYNLNYLMPSRTSKMLVTGNDIYTVGDFHNISYYRKNIFKTNLSGELLTGLNLEFLSSTNQTIDTDTASRVLGISENRQSGSLVIVGNFVKVNDISNLSGICSLDLNNRDINNLNINFSEFNFADIESTSNSKNIIVGDFGEDIKQRITGGNYFSSGGYYSGQQTIQNISSIGTGAVTITNVLGTFPGLVEYTGIIPDTLIYTGVSGYISNATGTIQFNTSPVIDDYINITILTGVQNGIDAPPLLGPGGLTYYYKNVFNDFEDHFTNISELYFLLTGSALINYLNIDFSNVENKIYLYPLISGSSGNSGNFNLTQNSNSFVLQNFSGGLDATYTTNIYTNDVTGTIIKNVTITGTGYYEKNIGIGSYSSSSSIRLTTTGLWNASGYYTYTSGMQFISANKGKRSIFNYDVSNRITTITGWGDNTYSQSLNGINLNPFDIRYLGAGSLFSVAQLNDGTITGWGDNTFNQLLGGTGLTNIKQISVGHYHVLALLDDNKVTGWGNNLNFQTTGINGSALTLTGVKQVSAGLFHSLAILNDDTITGWGLNTSYQTTGINGSALTLTGVKQVSAGGTHSLALFYNGRVTGWGNDANSKASRGNDLTDTQKVLAGSTHSVALLNNNVVTGWGNTASNRRVGEGLSGVIEIALGANGNHTLALFENYTLTGWGVSTSQQTTGINNAALNLTNIYSIAAGQNHSLALYKFNSLNNLNFYTSLGTGDVLKLYEDNRITGEIGQIFTGSGTMTGYVQDYGTGSFIQTSGNLRYVGLKTGLNEFIITGSHIDYNNNINITGRLSTVFTILYTGASIIQDINSIGYVGRVERTGFVNINQNVLVNDSFESSKYFIATGSTLINSGILFSESDKGKIQINGNLITGSGFATLPANVYPVSDQFSGLYNFISTGTGLMTFTGEYKHGGIARVTGENNFITTGYINATGQTTFTQQDFGVKYLNLIYTGEPNTGTLIPINTLNVNAWSIESGFNHIGGGLATILGSGDMTGYLTGSFSITGSTGISGNLEYLARYTGLFSGLVTGFKQDVSVGVSNAQTLVYNTSPYNINTGQTFTENITVNQTLTRTGIFNFTGLANTTGLYRSKTNFLITGLSTGYFPITGTGIVNLSGYVTLDKSLTNFISYPYPSGNSIAYLDLTGLNNFSGYFISGVKITGLYTKNYIGLFSGSSSGHYTGVWSGSGTFTGYQEIIFSGLDSGRKLVNFSQVLINSGLESGLVPNYTLGLYSGLKTIENINYNQALTITGSGYMEKIISGFGLAGVTSGSGLALLTGYLSGILDKNYTGTVNYETGILLTGFALGTNFALTGLFTGTITLTGIINTNLNLFTSGNASGEFLDTKTFTGSFDVFTGYNITGDFVKINPTSSGYYINRFTPTGENILIKINFNQNIDQISGNLRAQIYTGSLTGRVINNIIYGTRL